MSADKALSLAEKFALLYGTDATVAQRAALRARYRAASQVLFWPVTGTTLQWWLLASEGDGVVHERERLQNACAAGERLTFMDDFRLVRRQRDGEEGGGRRWTWVLSPKRFEQDLNTIRDLSRAHGPDSRIAERLTRCIEGLRQLPGFAGVRAQKLELQRAGCEAWQRTHRHTEPYLWSERIPYLTKSFSCYHRPEPLRLDVLVSAMVRRAGVKDAQNAALAQEVLAGIEAGPARPLA